MQIITSYNLQKFKFILNRLKILCRARFFIVPGRVLWAKWLVNKFQIFKVRIFLPFLLNRNFSRTPLCILIRMGSIRMRIKIPILSKKIIFLPRYFHSFQLFSVIFRYFSYFQIFQLFSVICSYFPFFSVISGYFR